MKEGQFIWQIFRVTDPNFCEKVQNHERTRQLIATQWQAVCRAYNAESIRTWAHDGSFAGFVFNINEHTPSSKAFRKVGNLYVPLKNTAEGKAVWKLVKAVGVQPNVNSILGEYGVDWQHALIVNGESKFATISGFYEKNIWFVKVPTLFTVEPAVGEWIPPSDWVSIKNWEFVREWDELSQEVEVADA